MGWTREIGETWGWRGGRQRSGLREEGVKEEKEEEALLMR